MVRDAAFWSTVTAIVSTFVALLAVILSQVPPVRELIKARRLRIVVPETIYLYHWMGNLQIAAFLTLHNVGGRDITVQKVECVLTHEEGLPKYRLPAQTYWPRSQSASGQELFIGWVPLKPAEHWAETVHFYKSWSVQDEEDSNAIGALIRNDINAKLALAKPDSPNNVVVADDRLAKDAKDFFEKRFTLAKGSYRLLIAAISEKSDVVSVRGFDFILYDHHLRTLRSVADDFKTGAGIYFQNPDPFKAGVTVRLRPIEDAEAEREYSGLRAA